jgi:hypothetical protein
VAAQAERSSDFRQHTWDPSQAGATFVAMTSGESEVSNGTLARIPGRIPPTAHRGWWIFIGLVLQLAGLGGPAFYVWRKAKHQDVSGLITVATVKLAWHESLHAKAGIDILVGGAVAFAVGSVVLARPFAKHWATLLVAVPVAALCGALVLGVAALVVAVVVAAIFSDGDLGGMDFGGGGGRTKKPKADPQSEQAPPGQPGGTSF